MDFIRVWKEVDINDIQNHILITDEIMGFCPGCKTPGLKLENLKQCPNCKREFKYVAAKDSKTANNIEAIMRIKKKLPNLILIDYNDYHRLTSKNKAFELFKK